MCPVKQCWTPSKIRERINTTIWYNKALLFLSVVQEQNGVTFSLAECSTGGIVVILSFYTKQLNIITTSTISSPIALSESGPDLQIAVEMVHDKGDRDASSAGHNIRMKLFFHISNVIILKVHKLETKIQNETLLRYYTSFIYCCTCLPAWR